MSVSFHAAAYRRFQLLSAVTHFEKQETDFSPPKLSSTLAYNRLKSSKPGSQDAETASGKSFSADNLFVTRGFHFFCFNEVDFFLLRKLFAYVTTSEPSSIKRHFFYMGTKTKTDCCEEVSCFIAVMKVIVGYCDAFFQTGTQVQSNKDKY